MHFCSKTRIKLTYTEQRNLKYNLFNGEVLELFAKDKCDLFKTNVSVMIHNINLAEKARNEKSITFVDGQLLVDCYKTTYMIQANVSVYNFVSGALPLIMLSYPETPKILLTIFNKFNIIKKVLR